MKKLTDLWVARRRDIKNDTVYIHLFVHEEIEFVVWDHKIPILFTSLVYVKSIIFWLCNN